MTEQAAHDFGCLAGSARTGWELVAFSTGLITAGEANEQGKDGIYE